MTDATVYLLENYKVVIDNYNHTLMKYEEGGKPITSGVNKGALTQPSWKVVGYYPNVKQCVQRLVKEELIDRSSLDRYIEQQHIVLERLEAYVRRLV